MFRLLRRPAGRQNVHHRDHNGASEAAEEGEWFKRSHVFAAVKIRSRSHARVFVPEGICQPGGHAETRRAAVPQRRSLRREMSEVNARSEKGLSPLVLNSAVKTHTEFNTSFKRIFQA